MTTKGRALAPSQHIRFTAGKTMALLLGVTLALSACGPQQPSAAAVVDDTTISDKDVQNVSLQISELDPQGEKLSPTNALVSLILEPYVVAEGNRVGKSVSDAEVLKVIDKISKPTVATANFVRMQLLAQQLDQASQLIVADQVGKADITINPRYGTFNAKQGFAPTSPNWMKATPSAAK